jgi:hypothetical protein
VDNELAHISCSCLGKDWRQSLQPDMPEARNIPAAAGQIEGAPGAAEADPAVTTGLIFGQTRNAAYSPGRFLS